MSKTLILLFHPNLSRSSANAALAQEAAKLANVEVVDVQALYPDGIDIYRDGEREAARLLAGRPHCAAVPDSLVFHAGHYAPVAGRGADPDVLP
ncbi:glutathione-regulated potassium-efflux system ancillary protein KefG [Cedecea neteri]|uniref:Glutathione-regulated potassium-efflux system ancillary protein KefG n=1 Tax=Cedecea neteri TaxID=158822 RepID=A0A2X3INJ1_9ENTR|nr:glutathione-regulated potassium-efflux system ancillary protein KefG [Cedecea neteri]